MFCGMLFFSSWGMEHKLIIVTRDGDLVLVDGGGVSIYKPFSLCLSPYSQEKS